MPGGASENPRRGTVRAVMLIGIMDRLEKAIDGSSNIRFTFVESTVAAKALEARHLCGPVAAMALGEAITAVALLAADTADAEDAVMLRMNVSGPLGGVLVEATGAGGLRGFTHRKVLNDLDIRNPVDTAAAWGDTGVVQIVTSRPGRLLNQAVLNVTPPQLRYVLARYFNHSMQVPTACAINVEAGAGGLISARGLLAQRMADSDAEAFVRVLESFEDGGVAARLVEPPPHAGAPAFARLFGRTGITVRDTRPLMFRCRCSRERTLAVLETLSSDDLQERLAEDDGQDITCHMCGQTYRATSSELRTVLDRKA